MGLLLVPKLTRRANKARVAEFFEVSIPAVDAWIRRGCPAIKRGGLDRPWEFDLAELCRWRFERMEPQPLEDPDHMAPRDRKAWYESEVTRRAIQDRAADLVPAEDVQAAIQSAYQIIAAGISTLPEKLREHGIEDEDVLQNFTAEIEPLLSTFCEQLSKLASIGSTADLAEDTTHG